jgi:serine/threonine-protein kinase
LKRVPANGGPAQTIADGLTNPWFGGDWGADNTIVLALSNGLFRVSASGGKPESLVRPNADKGELHLGWPEILPDSQWVLFTIRPQETTQGAQIAALNLETTETRMLFRGGSKAKYVEPGYLVYAAGETLEARTFDVKTLEVGKEPVAFDVKVAFIPPYRTWSYDLSPAGTLAYAAPRITSDSVRRLVWVNRQGQEELLPLPLDLSFNYPRIRPHGTEVALNLSGANRDIGILDLLRPSSVRRFTSDPREDAVPLWSPDGRYLFFASQLDGVFNIHRQAADASGSPELLFKSPRTQMPSTFTPDGTQLLTCCSIDIGILTLKEPREFKPLLQSASNPAISPNGRWLAYQSDESGENEIHVRPFPDVDSKHWTVSSGGGIQPRWGPDGKELFYLDRKTRDMMAVQVELEPEFRHLKPQRLFANRGYAFGGAVSYDISEDGRFLMVKHASVQEATRPPSITVVVNWIEEIRKRLPRR